MKTGPRGFSRAAARAFWLICNGCEEMEMFFGADAEKQARLWVTEHRSECEHAAAACQDEGSSTVAPPNPHPPSTTVAPPPPHPPSQTPKVASR